MAIPGQGFRFAADVLCEVSLHLIEPIVFTTASAFAVGGYNDGPYNTLGYNDPRGSLLYVASQNAMYVGAQIVVGWGLTTQEVATITQINADGTVLTTTLVNSHNPGETILAPTFPTQQPVDPHWQQSEMLGYLSRAQNEFLTDCGCFYQFATQNMVYGQLVQNTPGTCIEINRIAASQINTLVTSLTRTNNEVTCVTVNPHGLVAGSTFFMQNAAAGFGGVFEIDTVVSPTSFTYTQIAANGSATGGAVLYFTRLYETTQAELSMSDRTWKNNYVGTPSFWYQDRQGVYKFGVGGKPASNFPLQLLMSVRDTDTLGLLDGFLVPDVLVPIIKWKVLAYAFSKNGVQQDPQRAKYCEDRYRKGVAATNRFLTGMSLGLKGGA